MAFDAYDLHDEVSAMFGEIALAQTEGHDPISFYAMRTLDRWEGYEQERRKRREVDLGFAVHELHRWRRANVTRKKKRRGLHLTNTDRVRLADAIKRREMTPEEVSRETKVSVANARSIGQLSLIDDVA